MVRQNGWIRRAEMNNSPGPSWMMVTTELTRNWKSDGGKRTWYMKMANLLGWEGSRGLVNSCLVYSSTMKMETVSSSETSDSRWHLGPLVGKCRQTNNETTAAAGPPSAYNRGMVFSEQSAKQQLYSNRKTVFPIRPVPRCYKQDKSRIGFSSVRRVEWVGLWMSEWVRTAVQSLWAVAVRSC
jgi:hypothetical protein